MAERVVVDLAPGRVTVWTLPGTVMVVKEVDPGRLVVVVESVRCRKLEQKVVAMGPSPCRSDRQLEGLSPEGGLPPEQDPKSG